MGVLYWHDGGQQGFYSNLQAHHAPPYSASEAETDLPVNRFILADSETLCVN